MTDKDKRPLQQRSTQELERGRAQGIFSGRKRSLVEQILQERRRQESTAKKKSAVRRDRWKLLAQWAVALAALGSLVWAARNSLWR
jgi:hypothetical protein